MDLIEKIWAICEPAIRELGLELVDVEHVRAPGGSVLRLFIDREGGVTVGDCAGVSREIGHLLDAEDIMQRRYYLEVSSPGIDRVLRKSEDFEKFKGHEARVRAKTAIEGARKISGRIQRCTENVLFLETDAGKVIEIQLELIEKANLRGEVPFGRGKKNSKRGKR